MSASYSVQQTWAVFQNDGPNHLELWLNAGAFHGAEVPFVFHDSFELVGGENDLSSQMSTYWTNMASSGAWSGLQFGTPAAVTTR